MFEKFVAFLKNTFVYEEESQAETPEVVDTSDVPASGRTHREDKDITAVRTASASPRREMQQHSAPTQSLPPIDPGAFFAAPKKATLKTAPLYSTDPQAAAQKQADNFSALRPKPEDTHYRMIIDKVFYAKGQGVVVRGAIGVGVAKAGAASLIVHAANRTTLKTKVIAIERDGKVVNSAPAGCTVGLLLEGITRNDVHAGDVIGEI